MLSETIKKLQYFINKPITIFTKSTGRNFTDIQNSDYFTGICLSISIDMIETIHPITKCKNFFFIENIVGICEEQELDPENPEHQKIIEEIKNPKKEETKEIIINKDQNIDIEAINQLIKKS